MSRKRYTPEQIIGKLREAEVPLGYGAVGGHYGKIPLGLVGLPGEGAAALPQGGVQPPGVIEKFMLIGGSDLGHHQGGVPHQGQGHLCPHPSLHEVALWGPIPRLREPGLLSVQPFTQSYE